MRSSSLRSVFLMVVIGGLMISSPACGEKSSDTGQYLEFDSGGRYHPSGLGAWRARLCGDGSLEVSHVVGDKTQSGGVYMLTKSESRKLFSLFCAVDIKRLKSSARPGLPDEVSYSFELKDGSGTYCKSIWINDARDNPAIMDLVTYLETLIGKYAGEKPAMR